MNKIMIIGCPGSGKSVLSRELKDILEYPVLHLDFIYHIDNHTQISREELIEKVNEFSSSNDQFIIDGNYNNTMELRMRLCDTVILFDLPTDICLKNVIDRKNDGPRPDMAPGFDNSIMDDDFLDFVKNFRTIKIPEIEDRLKRNPHLQVIRLKSYEDKQTFLDSLR